ncbi:MAG: hypothetical protein JNK47_24825 [Mesorhizobium sp.]|nr:hypothetical protein [Mesorhizobium sp.]MBL8580431.1 hypothetical protein [Mesorhizobium sp.]
MERLLAVSQPDVQRYAKIQCATITKRLELLGHSGAKLAARLDVRKAEPAIG